MPAEEELSISTRRDITNRGDDMALQTPTVTVTNVTEPQSRLYKISFRMVSTDDSPGLPGLDISHTINYKHGNDIDAKVSEVKAYFQKKITAYQNAATVFGSPALATAVSSIQTGLVV